MYDFKFSQNIKIELLRVRRIKEGRHHVRRDAPLLLRAVTAPSPPSPASPFPSSAASPLRVTPPSASSLTATSAKKTLTGTCCTGSGAPSRSSGPYTRTVGRAAGVAGGGEGSGYGRGDGDAAEVRAARGGGT